MKIPKFELAKISEFESQDLILKEIELENLKLNLILVKASIKKETLEVKAFLNLCPHENIPLTINGDCLKKRSLFATEKVIECRNHYARFDLKEGLCFDGVCEGKRLKTFKVSIEEGSVYSLEQNF